MSWDLAKIRERVQCCACGGSLGRKQIAMAATPYVAGWRYPAAGNVALPRARMQAIGIICSKCVDLNRRPVRVVEFRGEDVVYHDVQDLLSVEEQRKCRKCGCTESRACLVEGVPCWWIEDDLCSACGLHCDGEG